MALGGAARFVVSGVSMASHTAVLEPGLDIVLRLNLTLGVSCAGQLSGSVKQHRLRAALAW